MIELKAKAKDRTPFVVVCLQECERMNTLIFTIRSSLEDLDAGLKGQLNITENMEKLANSMFINMVPDLWTKYAYASKKDLLIWFEDLLLRCLQLDEYSEEMIAPISLWISGLFNPMSYLTAIMQVTARNEGLALDNMMLKTTVLNIEKPKDVTERPEVGALIHGFFLQGAKWELGRGQEQGNLMDMIPKELYPELPVVHVTAIEKSK
jgi:dynein heavy chain